MSEVKKTLYFTRGMAIKHGDTTYPEGELIELSDEEAKPLKRWLEPAKAPTNDVNNASSEKATAEKAETEKAAAGKGDAEKDDAEKAKSNGGKK